MKKYRQTMIRTAALALLLALFALGCGDEFEPLSTASEQAPLQVTMTIPHHEQYNVTMSSKVVVHFNEPIDINTLNSRVKVLDRGGYMPEANISVYGNSIIVEPIKHWDERTEYTVHILPGVGSFNGHELTAEKTFTFSTGMRMPKAAEQLSVERIEPLPGEPCWDFMTFRMFFNEPIDRDTLEFGKSIRFVDLDTGEAHPGNVFGRSNQVVFDPDEDLTPGHTYRLTIDKQLRDYHNQALAEDYVVDFVAQSTGKRTVLAMDHCPSVLDGESFCASLPDNDQFPMSTYIPRQLNSMFSQSVFLGGTNTKAGGRLWSEFAESIVAPDNIPFVVRKGQKLTGKSLQFLVGGVIESSIFTGEITVTLLADAIGTMSGSEYVHGEAGLPATMRITLDSAMSFENETSNSLMPQPILGTVLVGQATVKPVDGMPEYEAMHIELAGFAEINLGPEFFPVDMSLQMIPPPTMPAAQAQDTTPPTIKSVSPVDMIVEPEDIREYLPTRMAGDRVVLYFSEPIDPDTIRDHIYLEGPDGRVAGKYDNFDPKIWFTPDEPLDPNTTYRIVALAGIKDIAGNETTQTRTWSFTTMPYQSSAVNPPMVAASVPARGDGHKMARNFFPEFYFTQIVDEETLVYGDTYGLYDLTLGGRLVPGTRKHYSVFFDFVPDEELIIGHLYRWVINDGVTNLDGLALDTDYDREPGGPPIVIDFEASEYSNFNETMFVSYAYADADVNGYLENDEVTTPANFMIMDSPMIKDPVYVMGFFPVNVHELSYYEDGEPHMEVNVVANTLQFGTSVSVSLFGDDKGMMDMGQFRILIRDSSTTDIYQAPEKLLGNQVDVAMTLHVENSILDSFLVHDMRMKIPSLLRYSRDGRMMTVIDGQTMAGMVIPVLGVVDIPVRVLMVASTVPNTRAF